MQGGETITTLAHVIQLAVAPVFLLTGIGALLGVLTNRLSRVIDRSRVIEGAVPCDDTALEEMVAREFRMLALRGRLINRAIILCTTSALLICIVIAALFIGAFLNIDMSIPIGVLFVVAMLSLVVGLIHFLREIHHAMQAAAMSCLRCREEEGGERR